MKTLFNNPRKAPRSPLFSKRFIPMFMIMLVAFSIMAFMTVDDKPPKNTFMPGVVFEIEVTDHEQSPPRTETIEAMVEGKNLKMDILPDSDGQEGAGEMIYRGNRGQNGEVIIVDDDKKEYYVMDDAFIKSMMGSIEKSKSMIDDAMKSLTKEQREMIERAQKKSGNKIPGMPGMMQKPTKPEIKNTGERGTKAGYPCVKFEVYKDGRKIREIWTTDWDNIDGGEEARDAFGSMNNFFKKIKDKFGNMPGGSSPYDDMNMENGFPVVTKNFSEDDGSLEDESALRSARRQSIDPDAFEPPAGYKRRSMMPPFDDD